MKTTITPRMAAEFLANNTHNRKINSDRVANYARDMKSGRWPYNGETVKIAVDGTIIDGQHRLEACVLAGTPFHTELIQGLPMSVQATVDTGRGRSVGDAFTLNGELYSRNLAAVCRRVWEWEAKNYRFASRPTATHSEALEMPERYPSLRRSAEMGHRISTVFPPARASAIATAHHIFLQIDPSDTAQFFASLETGADLPKGHPVLALRNRLTQDKLNVRAIPFHVSVGCCIRAWNAVRRGEELTMIKMTPDSAMPMPV